jgi:hypothetical protein
MITYAKRLPPNKPVKFSEEDPFIVTKTVRCSDKLFLKQMEEIVCTQILQPNKDIVDIYNFKILRENDKLNNFTYSYDMKRLGLLHIQDRALIDAFSKAIVSYNLLEILNIIKDKNKKLYDFLMKIKEYYFDIHSGNILLDEDSNYKLIDLEGIIQ